MIIELVVNIVYGIVHGLIFVIPSFSMPSELAGGLLGLIELLAGVTFIMPISTLVSALAWWVALQNTQFLMSITNWIIKKIPFLN